MDIRKGIIRFFLFENINYLGFKIFFLVFLGDTITTFVNLPISAFKDIINITGVVFRDETYDYVGTIDRISERATKARKE